MHITSNFVASVCKNAFTTQAINKCRYAPQSYKSLVFFFEKKVVAKKFSVSLARSNTY